ncbi:MAG: hypothetical protein HY315_06625 [Acidobacteria bacterium]|nr:hypothetical protein [Acidobacteriota bacterium]
MTSVNVHGTKVGTTLAALAIIASFSFYLPLIRGARLPAQFFFQWILPVAAGHIGLLLLLNVLLKARAASATVLYWVLSAAVLIAAGGASRSLALLLLAGATIALLIVGSALSGLLVAEEFQGWGTGLGFGIIAASAVSSWLAAFNLLTGWSIGSLAVIACAVAFRRSHVWSALRRAWGNIIPAWNLSTAVALEGVFLVAAFLLVAAASPETRSDAVRIYWPYVRMMARDSGFFDLPFQWGFVIPQAGLAYAAALLLLVGPVAVRWSMFICWLGLIAITGRLAINSSRNVSLSIVLVVASCPVLVWVASSLMQESFVSLVTVTLAVLTLGGKHPGTGRFWAGVGAMVGMAWVAKYSTLAYAVPLGVCALIRGLRATGWRKNLRGLAFAAASGFLAASPWLWHTYRQSGNPFFPFLLRLFPAPLWPNGVGTFNLDSFGISPNLQGWLLWPIDMTYHTNRFFEGFPGSLGMVLPVLLVLGVPGFWKGSRTTRFLVISAATGTFLLWFQTGYIRYWQPGLWLLAPAAAEGAARLARSSRSQFVLCAAALTISLFQLPVAMFNSQFDPRGWPWDYYAGKISEDDYLERYYPGFGKIRGLELFHRKWPRVWFTGYEAAGHLNVQPLEAMLWEIPLHGAADPRSQIRHLGSLGCDYWIVNRSAPDAQWFRATGLSNFYWEDKNLLTEEGPVAVFRMNSLREALQKFDERAVAGADLMLDGGFEKGDLEQLGHWRVEPADKWIFSESEAFAGRGYVVSRPGGAVRQDVPLPPGLARVEATLWTHAVRPSSQAQLDLQVVWTGALGNFISREFTSVRPEGQWTQRRIQRSVPAGAKYATVFVSSEGEDSGVRVDEVHLYSRAATGPGRQAGIHVRQ